MITKRAGQLPRRSVTQSMPRDAVVHASSIRCTRATCPATVGGGKPRSTTTVELSPSPLDLDHHAHHVLSIPGGRASCTSSPMARTPPLMNR